MLFQVSYLRREIDNFFQWYESHSRDPYANPSFIPLNWAILYGGSLCLNRKATESYFPRETRTSLVKRMCEKVIQSLNAMSFLRRPHLFGLIAYLIVESMAAKDEESTIFQLSLSLIVQLAQSLGLRKEPLNLGLDPQEGEL